MKSAPLTDYSTHAFWDRLFQSMPGSYGIWKDGTNYRAECNRVSGSDYNGPNFSTVCQATMDALTLGGKIVMAEGPYVVPTAMNITNSGVDIDGVSTPPFAEPLDTSVAPVHGTVLYPDTTFTSGNYFFNISATPKKYGIGFHNLMFYGKDTAGTIRANSISSTGAFHVTVDKCDVMYAQANAISLLASGDAGDSNNVTNCVVMNATGGTGIMDWCWLSRIENCEVLSCYDGIDVAYAVDVVGCQVASSSRHSFILRGETSLTGSRTYGSTNYNNVYIAGSDVQIVGNRFLSGGKTGAGGNDANIQHVTGSRIVIVGNNVYSADDGSTGYWLYSSNATAAAKDVLVENNFFGGTTPPSVAKYLETVAGVFQLRNNRGIVTENSGASAIISGQTHVHVTHGCSYTPVAADITITPTASSTADPTFYLWVSDITDTEFRVNCVVDPGVLTLPFGWAVRKV